MRIVIITGASSGMGREFALQLDKKLHSIDEYWLVGRNEEELAKTKFQKGIVSTCTGNKQYTARGKDACKLCRIWNGWRF